MKIAAIDIGSNAIRCQISNVFIYEGGPVFKRLEYIRYPMKLGEDVFATGYISEARETKFIKLLHALKLLMEVHEVEHYLICATSAMRMAQNAQEIIKRVYELLDMRIEVIDGFSEAEYINKVIHNLLDDKNYLHIDVGGGSTEFNVYVDHQKVASQSFELGSIRQLQRDGRSEMWEVMKEWVKNNTHKNHVTRAIGTGGNINKIYELAGKKTGKPIFKKQIEDIVDQLENMTMEERQSVLLLNPDRADVIVPAARIYLSAMNWARVESMLVPTVGLKDGMLQALYERHRAEVTPV
ncbi:phosphatase [Adhaeribacter arboris]|uniref:Phosphatase n=1 Tax=Adhaeribacter arboris TaxID=2072846 RepID=A0A2T2YEE3_9BACT|nr:phosphatase [Adhaeribacter arboris]PSR53828.1 phosphatase [Adhaeribacter arboris]